MKGRIAIIDRDTQDRQTLCDTIRERGHEVMAVDTPGGIDALLNRFLAHAVILNLDSLPINNHTIKTIKQNHPGVEIVALSSRSYHPELEEAMIHYIYGCLRIPVDTEELFYCLKGITEKGIVSKLSHS